MKIPKKLKIGSHVYTIEHVNLGLTDQNTDLGLCRATKNEITINSNPGIALSQQEATLFHEIIEAINYNYELELNHQQITTISEAFYQVLKDNKLIK